VANSFISSLETLDPSSVSNVSSLFFYVANNGNSRLVDGNTMQSYLSNRESTIVVRTSDYQIAGATTTVVTWEAAFRDPLGMWNANSASMIVANFDGYLQFKYASASKTGGGTYFRRRLYKNGANVPGSGLQAWRCYVTAYAWPSISGPIPCTSGDYFEMNQQYASANTINCVNLATWMEVIPLQVFK
jgi:hypothetical protein